MSICPPDSLQQRLGRKVVPDGSNDFQKALDEILCSDDSDFQNKSQRQKNVQLVQKESNENNDDHQISDQRKHKLIEREKCMLLTSHSDNNNNHNNYISSTLNCTFDLCQQQLQVWGNDTTNDISFSIINKDCVSKIATNTTNINTNNEHSFSLCESENHILKMGASCSSNFYDNREWNSVKSDINIDSVKPKKRGRLRKKRVSSEQTPELKNERAALYSQIEEIDKEKVSSTASKCQPQEIISQDVELPSVPHDFQGNSINTTSEKRTSLLSPDKDSETSCIQLTNNRLSPNVDSSGHIQITRVVGSGRARATKELDVSPHRLLTRRSNSPNGQIPSMNSKSGVNSCEERARSHSWSNGKIGNRANFKTSSLTIRQSLSNAVKNLTNSSQTSAEKTSKTLQNAITTTSKIPASVDVRDRECPQNIKTEGIPKISIVKAQTNEDVDADLAPIARRRAASESQTMRPRRLLPRTPDSSDQIQEHVHVRWADEKKGSSLSTSVFLSNIRPRSHSYGAMDSVPHRPILKKVAAF